MSFLPAALAIGASVVQGIGAFKASRANASAMEAQAIEEANASAAQELDLRRQARAAIGEQVAAQHSGGFMGGTGSALDTLRESQINAALDVLRIRREGTVKAQTLRTQASNTRTQGNFALASGLLGGASTAVGMKGDWAAARSGTSAGMSGYGGMTGDGSNMTGGISRVTAGLGT